MARYELQYKIDEFLLIGISRMLTHLINSLRFVRKRRPFCTAIFEGSHSAILSDGTVVCSCMDYAKDMPLGNIMSQPLETIWYGEPMANLRKSFVDGILPYWRCFSCEMLEWIDGPGSRYANIRLPGLFIIETNANCNLMCPGCFRGSILASRERVKMEMPVFEGIIDKISAIPHLHQIGLYDHGESFLYEDIFEMIRYVKQRVDGVFVWTTTNGLPLDSEERLKKCVESGIDLVIFSIDGASQDTYHKYRRGGGFQQAYANMKNLVRLRNEMRSPTPRVIWQYILFRWNDSDEEMEKAVRMSEEAGADELLWTLTRFPVFSFSKKYLLPWKRKHLQSWKGKRHFG